MSMLFKRTKILATIGPSVSSQAGIEALARAGANGFRLNFSHGSYEERDQQIAWVRQASAATGKPVALLQDLQGPKIRLGMLKDDMVLSVRPGDELVLAYGVEHDGGLTLPVQYNLADKVKPGEPIYIFDGKIRTTVVALEGDAAVRVRVENGGVLMSRKGINLPETDFGGDILTAKDIEDLAYGAQQDIDYVALSFVQSAEDINGLRQRLMALGSEAHIIAKIETKAAIEPDTLEAIIEASDGVMVARGDLAVEAGAEVVPIVQRRIIALCRAHGKLSIVATQMMASMVDHPEPTRAEASDVANAVIQGADTVMLSDETATGSYPVEAVSAMKRVILYTQDHAPVDPIADYDIPAVQRDAISAAAVQLAAQVGADAIVAETKSGATAANVAAHRPNLPIISVTSQVRSSQQLALSYANRSYVRPDDSQAGDKLARELKAEGLFGDGPATVVITSGDQPGVVGATNTVMIHVLQ